MPFKPKQSAGSVKAREAMSDIERAMQYDPVSGRQYFWLVGSLPDHCLGGCSPAEIALAISEAALPRKIVIRLGGGSDF